MLDLALKHQKYDEIWQGTPVLLMVVYFYWETQTSRWVYLILMFGCFKNFQMPFPKKNIITFLHVEPEIAFWQLVYFPPKFWTFFSQILGKKVSLSDDIKIAM